MLKTLIESQPRENGSPRAGWGAASVATHAILIVGAVVGTAVEAPGVASADPVPLVRYIRVDPPASRTAVTSSPTPAIRSPGLIIAPPSIPHELTFNCDPGTISIDSMLTSLGGDTLGTSDPGQPDTPGGSVYEAATVDRVVSPYSNNPQPIYPAQLRAVGIEGAVVARFVVDTLGRVEPESIDFLNATQPAFSESVRHALLRSRFTPARYGRWTVRQLVEQRFSFALTR